MKAFFQKPQSLSIRRDEEDGLAWKESMCSTFCVKSFYNSLTWGRSEPFPAYMVWTPWISTKASFFAWEAVWERILMLGQLKRRGWTLLNSCYMYKRERGVSWSSASSLSQNQNSMAAGFFSFLSGLRNAFFSKGKPT